MHNGSLAILVIPHEESIRSKDRSKTDGSIQVCLVILMGSHGSCDVPWELCYMCHDDVATAPWKHDAPSDGPRAMVYRVEFTSMIAALSREGGVAHPGRAVSDADEDTLQLAHAILKPTLHF